jgi:hypothetical protein
MGELDLDEFELHTFDQVSPPFIFLEPSNKWGADMVCHHPCPTSPLVYGSRWSGRSKMCQRTPSSPLTSIKSSWGQWISRKNSSHSQVAEWKGQIG